ncbi:MAG: hypothetical protein ACO1QR_14125 [Chthoniobacteraceae bacterium]
MFFRGKVTVVLLVSVLSLVAAAAWFVNREADSPPDPDLPPGKVQPYLRDGLLLAPDGTLWQMAHSGSGGPKSLTVTSLFPGDDWKQVSGNTFTAAAVKQDGTAWMWQRMLTGQFYSDVPVQIGKERDWEQVAYSRSSATLIKRDGTLWGMGDQYLGKPRNISVFPSDQQVQLGTTREWVAVENCNEVIYGLQRDGSIWQWGRTPRGGFELTPVRIGSTNDWAEIANCTEALAALKKDGSLWITGENAHRVAYAFVSGPANDFVRIGVENDWQNIMGGERSLIAQRSDASWWVTGENYGSQLGALHGAEELELGQPTLAHKGLKPWAWHVSSTTCVFLRQDGTFHYSGVTPKSHYAPPRGIAAAKVAVNNALKHLPGSPRLFDDPEPPRSMRPVRIGELPPSVIAALTRTK